ncbi:MAG: hypothetical protein ISS28_05265 [Candidatus Cloacimonetes bacterium]|nr:hypothetical protein [Candidatus Cloacimonadota bacterium]
MKQSILIFTILLCITFWACEEDETKPIDVSVTDLYISSTLTYLGDTLIVEFVLRNPSDRYIDVSIELIIIKAHTYDLTENYSDGIILVSWPNEEIPSGSSLKLYNVVIPSSIDIGDYYLIVAVSSENDDDETNNISKKSLTVKLAPLVFTDNFSSNYLQWYTTYHGNFEIVNGVLQISGENDGYQHNAYLNIHDISGYNAVESPTEYIVEVSHISGSTNERYGIGLKSGIVRYFYHITETGYYTLSTYNIESNEWGDLIAWTYAPYKLGSGEGKMRILYNDPEIVLYFNDEELDSYEVSALKFTSIYLYQQRDPVIQFDNVELYGYLSNFAGQVILHENEGLEISKI